MTTITVTKAVKVKGDFVLVPRKEYEELKRGYDDEPAVMTSALKRALARAHKARKAGRLLSLDELRRKLGLKR